MLKKYLAERRGQVAILFALLMPIFLLFIGVALDLGWYYLNVSRLQNAADAAAVAGAQTLISKGDNDDFFSDYKTVSLVDKYPGKVSNEYRPSNFSEKTKIENVEVIARDYVDKNLASAKYGSSIDAWTKTAFFAEPLLYEKDDTLYYVVKISEDIRHFFLPGWFDDMAAPVTAVAMISKNSSNTPENISVPSINTPENPLPIAPIRPEISDISIVDALETARNKSVVVGNWEIQNTYRQSKYNTTITNDDGTKITDFERRFGFEVYGGTGTEQTKKWNQYQDRYTKYLKGEHRRTEEIIIKPSPDGKNGTDNDGRKNLYGNLYSTQANGGKIYKEDEVDSLNIDFKQDVRFNTGSKYLPVSKKDSAADWDLTLGYKDGFGSLTSWREGDSINGTGDPAALMRIHSTINFDEAHEKRSTVTDEYDILWVRIESETMLAYPDVYVNGSSNDYNPMKSDGILKEFNSVRQIIINMNASNTKSTDRPVVIFYDGPERYSTDNSIRDSKPVIVNLNADFNGILYMPNSPVVLNGNGKNFNGFIVAKEYLALKTAGDFNTVKDGNTFRYFDNIGNEYYKIAEKQNGITNTMFIDAKGEVQYKSAGYTKTYGKYETFGRTDFSTYEYQISPMSASNLLIKSEEE